MDSAKRHCYRSPADELTLPGLVAEARVSYLSVGLTKGETLTNHNNITDSNKK